MERVLTLKANYFADVFGYDIYIVNTDSAEKQPFYSLSPNVKVINLAIDFDKMHGKPFYKRALLFVLKQAIYRIKLRRCLNELKPDITVSMLRREVSFLASIKDGSIKIAEAHAQRDSLRGPWGQKANIFKILFSQMWIRKMISSLKKMDCVVILTHADLENWNELNNVSVINNPLPFFPQLQSTCASKNVIAVGRYLPQKGFDMLLNAWKLVSDRHPDWTLRIFGEGMRDVLAAQVNELSIADSCILERPVSNIVEKYLDSSIFVLSSRYEGLPMVILEAMACGLPVVAFSSYGPNEVIRDGDDGILVENGNVLELAERISFLIDNEDVRKEMGKSARNNIQRLEIANIAEQWRKLFERAVLHQNNV